MGSLLDIVDGVGRVSGGLVLCGVTDETFLLGESDVGRGDSVSLIVVENLDLALLHHSDTAVGGSQILESSGQRRRTEGQFWRTTHNSNDGAVAVGIVGVDSLDEG